MPVPISPLFDSLGTDGDHFVSLPELIALGQTLYEYVYLCPR